MAHLKLNGKPIMIEYYFEVPSIRIHFDDTWSFTLRFFLQFRYSLLCRFCSVPIFSMFHLFVCVCICTWKILVHFTLSSSPLSINFSIFDGIAHAHHWFDCKFRRTYNPRSAKKFSYMHKPDEQSEKGHPIHSFDFKKWWCNHKIL